MALVTLNVYDMTNTTSQTANDTITGLNNLLYKGFGIGGVFHGAVEVFGEEWSFGYCAQGTGVFACTPRANAAYTFREAVPLGVTALTYQDWKRQVARLQDEWPGTSYDVLQRNCCHFCGELVRVLGCGEVPPWLNRLATSADKTLVGIANVYDSFTGLGDSLTSWFNDNLGQERLADEPGQQAAAEEERQGER